MSAMTLRAMSLVFAGMTLRSEIRSATRLTSASIALRNSGSISICFRSSRSKASFWMICTTCAGKNERMSPIHCATRGAERPSPPRRLRGSAAACRRHRHRARSSAADSRRSSPDSAEAVSSSAPIASRQRRSRSSSADAVAGLGRLPRRPSSMLGPSSNGPQPFQVPAPALAAIRRRYQRRPAAAPARPSTASISRRRSMLSRLEKTRRSSGRCAMKASSSSVSARHRPRRADASS